ncbi:MAG: hypothetical protein P9L97_03500 [Candidatus Tenebribacter davisii]|jgi:hypothetical protein|nr:hypothetical protein [Candidatus Tenebribacter davisii]
MKEQNKKNNTSKKISGFDPVFTANKNQMFVINAVNSLDNNTIRLIVLTKAMLLNRQLREGNRGILRKKGSEATLNLLIDGCDFFMKTAGKIENQDILNGFNTAIKAVRAMANMFLLDIHQKEK